MNKNEYININKVAEAKGLKSNRSLRLEINKPESKYIAREVKVNGGTSYEILYSSLEPEIQQKLKENSTQSTALVPRNYQPTTFVSESARLTSLARLDIVKALLNYRKRFSTKKEADSMFLDLYNSGMYLPKVFKFIGTISIGTLHRWVKSYEKYENAECLIPQYKFNKQGEYNTILTDEMKHVLLRFLLHQNKFNYGKAIKLTKEILRKQGYENLPCDLTFKRYAENFRKNNYAEWVLKREGMKAYHDKVEPYIERDISKIEVGDIIIADGHVLNFQVINPFTGKPTRATLVGFLDWKSTALVGYEIMMTENTQCIASALRNSILNLGIIPKVVYQDNGRAFKSKFFQSCDFDEDGFNGVYANLNIHSVFAKPYNARAKVIERFFREFQEEFEKMMPSYIGTSIEDKPAWMKRGEKLHLKLHENETNNHIPTVQEVIKYINCWLEFHNKKPCPNDRSKTIQEMLDSVQKADCRQRAERSEDPFNAGNQARKINPEILNTLMMKTECRTITKHGITFLNMHYRSEAILGLREQVFIRYSLFDLSKIFVYSSKGEFLCVAKRVQKVHPMANVLGTVKDMEEYKQQYKKQQQIKNRLVKQIKKNFTSDELQVLEIEQEQSIEIEPIIEEKPKRERRKRGRAEGESVSDTRLMRAHKTTPREQQMNRPIFSSNYEKYEWLMKNGCTNSDDRTWLTQYIRSDEYQNIYGD